MTWFYAAFGLRIAADIALPELPTINAGPVDLTIQCGTTPATDLPDGKQIGPFLWASRTELKLQVPGIATYLIQDGSRIVVDQRAGIDSDSVRAFLLGPAIGAAMWQRGHLVLHGCAVLINGQALICIGASGAGKSTLALSLMRRGHLVLADDLAVVDERNQLLPGLSDLKVWHDMAVASDLRVETLGRFRPGIDKYHVPSGSVPLGAVPIRAVCVLGSDLTDGVELTPIDGMARFTALRQDSYRREYIDGMGRKREHMALCTALANKVAMWRVVRPRGVEAIDALADALMGERTIVG